MAAEAIACWQEGLLQAPGNADLQFEVGHAFFWGHYVPQDLDGAAALLRRAAEQGHTEARNKLGVMYQTGMGVPQSGERAVELFRCSAEQGDTWAMSKLGLMFHEGQGVRQDFREACFWYRVCCECEANPYDALEAARWRDRMAARITDAEIAVIRARARQWLTEHPYGTVL